MKYINNIKTPNDLKSVPKEKLGNVCDELRLHITETINEIGGHLAPTLGAVEITTAIHYVFVIYNLNSSHTFPSFSLGTLFRSFGVFILFIYFIYFLLKQILCIKVSFNNSGWHVIPTCIPCFTPITSFL